MTTQNFQNHSTLNYLTRSHKIYFMCVGLLNVASLAYIVYAAINCHGRINSVFFELIAISLLSGYFMFRSFSLKAQDRAIRAEENLRHFVLTGKLLDKAIRIKQIVALRFASDEEFVALAERAVKENLSNKEIKQAIKNWREDKHRA